MLGSQVSFYVETEIATNRFKPEIAEKPQEAIPNFQYSISDIPVSIGLYSVCGFFAVKGLYHVIKTFKIIRKKQLCDSFKKFKSD